MHLPSYLAYLWHTLRAKRLPYERATSIYELPYKALAKQGITLLIFDLDDTLTGHGAPLDTRAKQLLRRLAKRFTLSVLSNGTQRKERLKGLPVFCAESTAKPSPMAVQEVLTQTRTKPTRAAFVGDKRSMDMYAAYRAGCAAAFLVAPYASIFGGPQAPLPLRIIRGCAL